MVFLDFLRRHRKREHIIITEEAVTRLRRDGVGESVRWDDLQEVSIVTTDESSHQEDVFFLLLRVDGRSGCAVPQGADGVGELLGWVERKLPGLNPEEVTRAMGSTPNAKFTCWQRRNA